MKVSILVPVYGVEQFIEPCAVSLFKQTYRDIEYIFVDDCTPDRSIEILKRVLQEYPRRQQQTRIIRHDHNCGLGAARLTATRAATGEALMHVDSDDYVATNAVELLVKQMEQTGADIVDGGYAIVSKGVIKKKQTPFHGAKETYLKTILCQNLVFNQIWARLIRRDLCIKHKVLSVEGVDYSEDYCVVPRMLLDGERSWIDETTYYYRDDNSNSYTHSLNLKHHQSYLRSNRIVVEAFLQQDTSGRYRNAVEMSMLAVLRHARRFEVPLSFVDELFPYQPKGFIAKGLWKLLRSPVPYPISEKIYRMARRIYFLSIHH